MSLQWTAVATILYLEVIFLILMLLPIIKPTTWHKIFNSKIVLFIKRYKYIQHILVGILGLLLLDAIRDVSRYTRNFSDTEVGAQTPTAEVQYHMKLFRAQRNFYIAGFAMFLYYVIRALASKISYEAQLIISNSAVMKQAESASKMAKSMLGSENARDSGDSPALQQQINKLETDKRALSKELEVKDKDVTAMKKQSDSLKKEYDRLLEDFNQLQRQTGSVSDRKND